MREYVKHTLFIFPILSISQFIGIKLWEIGILREVDIILFSFNLNLLAIGYAILLTKKAEEATDEFAPFINAAKSALTKTKPEVGKQVESELDKLMNVKIK